MLVVVDQEGGTPRGTVGADSCGTQAASPSGRCAGRRPSPTAGTHPDELNVVPPNYHGADLSVAAFERDLPKLLATAPGRWVAYAHGTRLRIANTQPELYKYCLRELGLGHEQFVVRLIMPVAGPDVESVLR